MEWAQTLNAFIGTQAPSTSSDELEQETNRQLRRLYLDDAKKVKEAEAEKLRQQSASSESSLSLAIPKFFTPRAGESELRGKVRKEARTRFLEKKAGETLDERGITELRTAIEEYTSLDDKMNRRINYDGFCQAASSAPQTPAAQRYFAAKIFNRFPRDDQGCVDADALVLYVMRKARLRRLRVSLTCYDELGVGALREMDLENYVFEQLPQMPQLSQLEPDFYPYYVFTAVRKFFFFLDPGKKGRIKINDLLHSTVLSEFNQLRLIQPAAATGKKRGGWFSARNALHVYGGYISLDADHNGMLSRAEFARYNGRSLTDAFVDRLWQEDRLYKSPETGELEMDYKGFLDFTLAMEYSHTPQAIAYFWRMLDINKTGYLTLFTLNYFFREVQQKMVKLGHEPVNAADVIANEIFDMVRPVHPHQITLNDLIRSNYGHTIVSILIDVTGFWRYDNRESLIQDKDEEEKASG